MEKIEKMKFRKKPQTTKMLQQETEHFCQNCKYFDGTRYLELQNSKGYCSAKNIVLYKTKYNVCLDFVGLLAGEKE